MLWKWHVVLLNSKKLPSTNNFFLLPLCPDFFLSLSVLTYVDIFCSAFTTAVLTKTHVFQFEKLLYLSSRVALENTEYIQDYN